MVITTRYWDLVTGKLQELNWTLHKLSAVSGIPYSTLRNYGCGHSPTIEKADKILLALGITMTLGGAEKGNEP